MHKQLAILVLAASIFNPAHSAEPDSECKNIEASDSSVIGSWLTVDPTMTVRTIFKPDHTFNAWAVEKGIIIAQTEGTWQLVGVQLKYSYIYSFIGPIPSNYEDIDYLLQIDCDRLVYKNDGNVSTMLRVRA